ncbi:putative cell survival pathways protein [Tulasnella sp. 331]|nr:putative cell survival pathways protein [Tulasnella sp. 331]KAG8877970.1 putative cell survival pathways protein [Tulasnella sp. 332]
MFSSFFADSNTTNLHPVTLNLTPSELYGELTSEDLNWVCAGGFATETQIWYQFLEDGTFMMCQIIHSAVGLWYPNVQFTFRMYNPTTKEHTWRSANVSSFVSPIPGSDDKRSCKSDHFTIKFKPAVDGGDEGYTVIANAADDLQVSLEVTRPASIAGFKVGKGPKGGYSYFGTDVNKPEGYVFHKFWPRTSVAGHIIHKGQAISATGHGMFVHAIQGMRPNLVASKWNFATFQSEEKGGVAAVMMELSTTDAFGQQGSGSGGVKINVGGVVAGGKLVAVTAETIWPHETAAANPDLQSRAIHHDSKRDKDTGYEAPQRITYEWAGPSIIEGSAGNVKATLDLPLGDPQSYAGLIDKVDVLAEIPKVLKTVLAYAAGTKPYIYTWYNPASLSVTLADGETMTVKGSVFNEATWINKFRVALTYVGATFSEFNECSGLLRRSPASRATSAFIRAARFRGAFSYSTTSHAQDRNGRFHDERDDHNHKIPPVVPLWARTAASAFRTGLGRPALMPQIAALVRNGAFVPQKRSFHATKRCSTPPLLVLLAGLLKSSTALSAVQTVTRIALSFYPVMWFKHRILSFLSKVDVGDNADKLVKQAHFLRVSNKLTWAATIILLLPGVLIGLTLLASSERTPLTGRWRVIMLSPAEEEEISADLQGQKWYDTIRDILIQSSGGQQPSVVPLNDWRTAWVESTMRRLEQAVLLLSDGEGYRQAYERALLASQNNQFPLFPPPPNYPLFPRVRAASLLHEAVPHSQLDHTSAGYDSIEHTHHIPPHALLGPPYSLLIVNKDESNAFSYGFGPGGAGGVVLYTGFLDDILRSSSQAAIPQPNPPPVSTSLFSNFLSSRSSPSPPVVPPTPTAEQTAHLAALLAHELSHLILSHHIETLSSGTILFPSLISICIDTVRSILFPLTWVLGPFASDALDRTLRLGVDDFTKAGESCSSRKMEIEADVVSTRLLALAGFDPRKAVSFWEERLRSKALADPGPEDHGGLHRNFWDRHGSHPEWEDRVISLKKELASWDVARTRALEKLKREAKR